MSTHEEQKRRAGELLANCWSDINATRGDPDHPFITPEELYERVRGLRWDDHLHDPELIRTRLAASYMASCHAANLESLPPSASRSARMRLVRICEKAVDYLRGRDTPQTYGRPVLTEIENHIQRCEAAVKNCAEVKPNPHAEPPAPKTKPPEAG